MTEWPLIGIQKPTEQHIRDYLTSRGSTEFTYKEVGMTRAEHSHKEFVCDHNRVKLGNGLATFKKAAAALRLWHQFELGWVRIATREAPLEEGTTVCVLARITIFWILFACRIVYVIQDEGPIKKFGFSYGTLPGHPESGEERFSIEWNTEDDSVWYDILAYSKPGNFAASLGKPFARLMQKRFARDSMRVMQEYIS